MQSLKAGDLKPGMVLKDAKQNVYLVVSKPGGGRLLLKLGTGDAGPILVNPNRIGKWQNIELSQDKLDWQHFRDALLEWEFSPVYDSSLTLKQINKIFGLNVSLEDILKDKRKKNTA